VLPLPLEDGFFTQIGKETVIGGVETSCPDPEEPKRVDYRTLFYHDNGRGLKGLEQFASGPERGKDIRLTLLSNGRVAVFTRPQGGEYGLGKIAYVELDSLEELNAANLQRAKVIENQFAQEEWGGANELHLLPDGRIGVIGHIAYKDEENNRHYYVMSFLYNPKDHSSTPIKILATREDFPPGAAKATDLGDVVFSGGMVRHGNGKATLYVGLSDVEAGSIKIDDPFWEVEQKNLAGPTQRAEATA